MILKGYADGSDTTPDLTCGKDYTHHGSFFTDDVGDARFVANFAWEEPTTNSTADVEKPVQTGSKLDRSKPRNKYDREILPNIYVDVYDVLDAFKTGSPAVDHAIKKLLAAGERGEKDKLQDLQEAIDSIQSRINKLKEIT